MIERDDIKNISVSLDTSGGEITPDLFRELANAMNTVNGRGNENGVRIIWLDVTTGGDYERDCCWAVAYYCER